MRRKYPICAECGTEINPSEWDDGNKYFYDGEVMCKECFVHWLEDQGIDAIARAMGVAVIYVEEA